ncbi:MAG: hypothetical protein AB1441_01335 [Bacillota bacterium]
MASFVDLAVSAQGYGDEPAFDHRARMTRTVVVKPHNGKELLETFAAFTRTHRTIRHVRIFSHSYPRGVIMTDMSGFYHSRGPNDTPQAAYVADLERAVAEGRIVFAPNCTISLFGCNLTSEGFTLKLSQAVSGTVIAATAGVYPEIAGGRETGVFIAVTRWQKFVKGQLAVPNLGKRYRAW